MSAEENYEKALSAQHGRTIDFVKFAEAKNAALLTLCSVWIGTVIALLRSDQELPLGYAPVLKIVVPMLCVAAIIALVSFLPKSLRRFYRPEDIDDENLLFFGDVAKLDVEDYACRVKSRYSPSGDHDFREKYIRDLVVQTWVHSRIAATKFTAFNRAAVIVLVAFAVVAMPPSWWLARQVVQLVSRHAAPDLRHQSKGQADKARLGKPGGSIGEASGGLREGQMRPGLPA